MKNKYFCVYLASSCASFSICTLFVLLGVLLFSGATMAQTLAMKHPLCPGVSTEIVYPMQLGSLRLRNGEIGWLYLDGVGELYASPNVSKSSSSPASNGVIRLRGPEQHRVHIELELITANDTNNTQILPENYKNIDSENDAHLLSINTIRLFARGAPEVRHIVNNEYEVLLPKSREMGYVETDLIVGLEAQVKASSLPMKISSSIRLRCLGVSEG